MDLHTREHCSNPMVTQSGSIRSSLTLCAYFNNSERLHHGQDLCGIISMPNLSPIIHCLRSKPDPHLRNDVGSLPLDMDFIQRNAKELHS